MRVIARIDTSKVKKSQLIKLMMSDDRFNIFDKSVIVRFVNMIYDVSGTRVYAIYNKSCCDENPGFDDWEYRDKEVSIIKLKLSYKSILNYI